MRRAVIATGLTAAVIGLLAFTGVIGGAQDAEATVDADAATADIDPRFVGNWDLVSFVSFRESGEAVDNRYIGRIIYDARGNMTGIGMPRDLPQRPRNADGSQPRTGFAYWSNVEQRLEEGFIIHHVVGSPLNPSWVGTELVRFFEFDEGNDILRLSIREDDSPSGRITGTLTWRKIE